MNDSGIITGPRLRFEGNVDEGALFYHLRKGVKYRLVEGSPTLILNYPLKVVRLDPAWISVLDGLASRGPFSLKTFINHVGLKNSEKTERFLNCLVLKGFLERSGAETMTSFPFVSVIIPVRNRAEMIAECLQSLEALKYPHDRIEIIVVDDASEDDTPAVVSTFQVKLISLQEHRHASFSRNKAAAEAAGDLLAFIDSDCLADPLWLTELAPAFREPAVGAVGGIVEAHREPRGLARYEMVRSPLKVSSWYRRSGHDDRLFYVPSCNLLVRKNLFMKVGGFRADLHVGEDVDLCWRLQDHGGEIEYRHSGKIHHKHRNRLWSFCSRRFQYGTSEPMLQKLHPERRKTFLVPPPSFLFWGVTVLSLALRFFPLATVGLGILFAESLYKFREIRQNKIPLGLREVGFAVLRSYLGFFYQCCAFVSRYYLLWAFLFLPLFPFPSFLFFGMHFLTGTMEYLTQRPQLSPLEFAIYFTLDQMSYQTGVWWGCIRYSNFYAVIPRIKTHI